MSNKKLNGRRAKKAFRPGNSLGVEQKTFNLIYALVTGKMPSFSKFMEVFPCGTVDVGTRGLDVWDCRHGVEFFKWFLFSGDCELDEDYDDNKRHVELFAIPK